MTSGGNSDRLMSEINVTPFVDVMLVLLIIFMVTAPMMIEGVNVSLPEATSNPLESREKPLTITIDDNQKIFIIEAEVTLASLREKLHFILENRPNRNVYLKAGKDIPYGVVIRVMSEIKAAGARKLGMVTKPLSSAGSKKEAGRKKGVREK
ncbi:MAG: protein TolR [Desulfobacterales bacterium]|nr:protein TolR [Desulfobacterales bacterium]